MSKITSKATSKTTVKSKAIKEATPKKMDLLLESINEDADLELAETETEETTTETITEEITETAEAGTEETTDAVTITEEESETDEITDTTPTETLTIPVAKPVIPATPLRKRKLFTLVTANYSCLKLVKMIKDGKIRYDLEQQRRSVWNLKQRQDLIDSLIFNFPIPHIFLIDKKDSSDDMFVLDGGQRLRTLAGYLNNEFSLNANIRPFIDGDTSYILAGKKFAQLPEELQVRLKSTVLYAYKLENIEEDDITEMFRRLQSGTPFKSIELIRIDMPQDYKSFTNEMLKTVFFKDAVNISENSRKHFTELESLLQTLMITSGTERDFSRSEMQKFTRAYDLTEAFKNEFRMLIDYCGELFVGDKLQFLAKANIPVIVKVCQLAVDADLDLMPVREFFVNFFANQLERSAYNATKQAGSAKWGNVTRRYEILKEAFVAQFPQIAE